MKMMSLASVQLQYEERANFNLLGRSRNIIYCLSVCLICLPVATPLHESSK